MRTRIRTIILLVLLLLLLLLLPSALPMLTLLLLLLGVVFFKLLETLDCCLRYISVFQFRPGPLYLFDSLDRKKKDKQSIV